MSELKRVAVPTGSELKPYYKFYLREMEPVPQEKLDLLDAGPADSAKALPLADRSKLFEPGYFHKGKMF